MVESDKESWLVENMSSKINISWSLNIFHHQSNTPNVILNHIIPYTIINIHLNNNPVIINFSFNIVLDVHIPIRKVNNITSACPHTTMSVSILYPYCPLCFSPIFSCCCHHHSTMNLQNHCRQSIGCSYRQSCHLHWKTGCLYSVTSRTCYCHSIAILLTGTDFNWGSCRNGHLVTQKYYDWRFECYDVMVHCYVRPQTTAFYWMSFSWGYFQYQFPFPHNIWCWAWTMTRGVH